MHYNKILVKTSNQKENLFELRKEKAFENRYSSMCVVVHALKSEKQQVDGVFRRMARGNNLIHALFRGSKI